MATAIVTDAAVVFHGDQDTVHSTPATVTTGNFSVASDVAVWTNDDDAPLAYFVLRLKAAGLSAAPDLGASIGLYTLLQNVQSTNDSFIPSDAFPHVYLGGFPVHNTEADQTIALGPVRLPVPYTSTIHEFYIKNNTGVSLGTDWELYVTPVTLGPHAA